MRGRELKLARERAPRIRLKLRLKRSSRDGFRLNGRELAVLSLSLCVLSVVIPGESLRVRGLGSRLRRKATKKLPTIFHRERESIPGDYLSRLSADFHRHFPPLPPLSAMTRASFRDFATKFPLLCAHPANQRDELGGSCLRATRPHPLPRSSLSDASAPDATSRGQVGAVPCAFYEKERGGGRSERTCRSGRLGETRGREKKSRSDYEHRE